MENLIPFVPVLIVAGYAFGQLLGWISREAHLVRVERQRAERHYKRRLAEWGNPTVAYRLRSWL